MKTIDKILTVIGYVLNFAPCVLMGAYSAKSAIEIVKSGDTGLELLVMGGLILAAVLFWLLHIIIHEGGHLVCGLLTGWKFLSFRVGNLVLINQNGKLKWKKTTVMGTGGQCLLIPPECDYENCPFFLYLFGGGFANLLTSVIAIVVGIFTGGIVQIIFNLYAIIGIGLGFFANLFPAKMGGVMNDGYQIFVEFPRNKEMKKYTCCLMIANAVLTEKDSTKALPLDVRNIILDLDGNDLSNTSVVNLLFFKNSILQEECKYKEAKEIFQKIVDDPDVLELFKYEAKCELLYYEIMGECNEKKIEALYDDKLKKYIKATALYPSRKRLMYAYYLVYKKDEEKADKEYEALLKVSKTHPSKAEIAIELKEAERVRAHFECKYWNSEKKECRG